MVIFDVLCFSTCARCSHGAQHWYENNRYPTFLYCLLGFHSVEHGGPHSMEAAHIIHALLFVSPAQHISTNLMRISAPACAFDRRAILVSTASIFISVVLAQHILSDPNFLFTLSLYSCFRTYHAPTCPSQSSGAGYRGD